VILLENSNEWNLFPAKRRILKKKEEKEKWSKDWKAKKGETSYEEAPCFKRRKEQKKRMKFTSCWKRFYQKKERKEITFSYSAKSDV
jgi:hypothetical protein